MRAALRLLALALLVAALAAGAGLGAAAKAQAAGCGLSVKYKSSVRINQTYLISIKWSQNSSGGLGSVKWGVGSAQAAVNAVQFVGGTYNGYALSLVSHRAGKVVLYFAVDTGFCQETFSRTVKVHS